MPTSLPTLIGGMQGGKGSLVISLVKRVRCQGFMVNRFKPRGILVIDEPPHLPINRGA